MLLCEDMASSEKSYSIVSNFLSLGGALMGVNTYTLMQTATWS